LIVFVIVIKLRKNAPLGGITGGVVGISLFFIPQLVYYGAYSRVALEAANMINATLSI
jgi:hypothetical protein